MYMFLLFLGFCETTVQDKKIDSEHSARGWARLIQRLSSVARWCLGCLHVSDPWSIIFYYLLQDVEGFPLQSYIIMACRSCRNYFIVFLLSCWLMYSARSWWNPRPGVGMCRVSGPGRSPRESGGWGRASPSGSPWSRHNTWSHKCNICYIALN